MPNIFSRIAAANQSGGEHPVTGSVRAEPWVKRTIDPVYVGADDSVWLYWVIPTVPLDLEDDSRRLAVGADLEALLAEVGDTSPRPIGHAKLAIDKREIHLISILWEDLPRPPRSATRELVAHLEEAFRTHLSPVKTLFLGVKLRRRSIDGKNSLWQVLVDGVQATLGQSWVDLDPYKADANLIGGILARHDARCPTQAELYQLQSWYSGGRGPAKIVAEPEKLVVPSWDTWEMATLMRFDQQAMNAPGHRWMADAMSHRDGASVISVRAEMERPETTRHRARAAQRKLISHIEEQSITGDLERAEDSELLGLAKATEDWVSQNNKATLTNASIIMARKYRASAKTYLDDLRTMYGIEAKVLEERQVKALEETLPTSPRRANPFLHDTNLDMLAYAGMGSFGALGDPAGLHLGITLPEGTLCWVDPGRAAAGDGVSQSPALGIFAEPGGGKALALDTPLPTPTGWTTMGEVVEEDGLLDDAGRPCRVTFAT
ncbi:MAG: hypothetical protein ACRD0J_12535, partial [Acidimicrobiales bacterium]